MPLPDHLAEVAMTYACPHCGHPQTKNGRWFRTRGKYKCASCRQVVQLTYSAKVALFAVYDHTKAL
jgi:transposase-like protein